MQRSDREGTPQSSASSEVREKIADDGKRDIPSAWERVPEYGI